MQPGRSRLKPDSLGFALNGAAQALMSVRKGSALPQALAAVFQRTAAHPQGRGAIQDLAYRAMRQLGAVDALLAMLTDKPVSPPELHALLSCALALLHPLEGEANLPYESHTVVDQAVTAAAASPATARAKGLINAVLRRYLRERDRLSADLEGDPVARWNYPLWWIDDVRSAYPDRWQDILAAGNLAPPLTLRVNRRHTTPEAYLARLTAAGLEATIIGPDAVRLGRGLPVAQIPGFDAGDVSVQDAAAQLAAPLLDVHDGMRVLDACAAPGGKTGHLLECADIDLLALDADSQRLVRIKENLTRLGQKAEVRQGDASSSAWWDGTMFDRILADVPCTASGIVRRHPDIRWLRRPEDATRLSAIASSILDNLWTKLRPGGKLLFVTCSLWPMESENQADAFARRQEAIRLPSPGQLLPTASATLDHDGLFYALFQKPDL